ncbi:hypothetical protein SCHPADRAFT_931461 [Schizopora paradoxa]|uniref:PHD-type domain-containing protein n=1 Tax=Schizopora paradoxa TaxID=27342 RepID=A0A0H2RBY1_9AGAM|nr:hypothetical protein SCHPADRAFT_931461 [Schizopora paradoxa]
MDVDDDCCTVCKKTNAASYLLKCRKCSLFFHHLCLNPPMPKEMVLSVARAIQREKSGGKPFKGWSCQSCQQDKSHETTTRTIRLPQSSSGASSNSMLRHREPDVIELSSDEETNSNSKLDQPPNRYSSVASSSSTFAFDERLTPKAPTLTTKKVKAKTTGVPTRDRLSLKSSTSMPPPAASTSQRPPSDTTTAFQEYTSPLASLKKASSMTTSTHPHPHPHPIPHRNSFSNLGGGITSSSSSNPAQPVARSSTVPSLDQTAPLSPLKSALQRQMSAVTVRPSSPTPPISRPESRAADTPVRNMRMGSTATTNDLPPNNIILNYGVFKDPPPLPEARNSGVLKPRKPTHTKLLDRMDRAPGQRTFTHTIEAYALKNYGKHAFERLLKTNSRFESRSLITILRPQCLPSGWRRGAALPAEPKISRKSRSTHLPFVKQEHDDAMDLDH